MEPPAAVAKVSVVPASSSRVRDEARGQFRDITAIARQGIFFLETPAAAALATLEEVMEIAVAAAPAMLSQPTVAVTEQVTFNRGFVGDSRADIERSTIVEVTAMAACSVEVLPTVVHAAGISTSQSERSGATPESEVTLPDVERISATSVSTF